MMIENKTKMVNRKYLIPFILITCLFFMWGIPNNLNGILNFYNL